ncbi:MAG: hypothetical protein KI793_13000 [Rivularia sp. (in: Bacteria)]|nr:hypothetical protein [Rivularia sp. MS3]
MVDITSATALISSVVALFGSYISYRQVRQGIQRLEVEQKKIEAQFGQELSAERSVQKLLECTKWKRRTFNTLKYHLGGFEDDELRKILIRAGAIRFEEDVETWGLLERNIIELERESFTEKF